MEPQKQSLEGLEELRDVLQLCSPAKWYCPALGKGSLGKCISSAIAGWGVGGWG